MYSPQKRHGVGLHRSTTVNNPFSQLDIAIVAINVTMTCKNVPLYRERTQFVRVDDTFPRLSPFDGRPV